MSNNNKGNEARQLRLSQRDSCSLCLLKTSPFTEEELGILSDLRQIKQQARTIKSRLNDIQPDWKSRINDRVVPLPAGEAEILIRRLGELRAEWSDRIQRYEQASHRRMVILGHEDP